MSVVFVPTFDSTIGIYYRKRESPKKNYTFLSLFRFHSARRASRLSGTMEHRSTSKMQPFLFPFYRHSIIFAQFSCSHGCPLTDYLFWLLFRSFRLASRTAMEEPKWHRDAVYFVSSTVPVTRPPLADCCGVFTSPVSCSRPTPRPD